MTAPRPPTDDSADADDVRLALAGDSKAFGRLFDRHAARVRAVAAAVSCDWAAVEDLTQEAFLRAYKKLPSLRRPERFGSWVGGIARRVARERRRGRHRDRLAFVEGNGEAQAAGDVDWLERSEEIERVLELVAGLPERERLALHSYFFNEQRGDAAAEALGVSRSGFYALLNRGLDRVRKRLAKVPLNTESKADEIT